MRDAVSAALLLGGATLMLLAAVGLQQFDDVFARMHAATKAVTLGLALIVAGAAIQLGDAGGVAKLVLVLVLQFVTAPVAAHLVGRASYRAGLPRQTVVDELAADDLRSDGGPG